MLVESVVREASTASRESSKAGAGVGTGSERTVSAGSQQRERKCGSNTSRASNNSRSSEGQRGNGQILHERSDQWRDGLRTGDVVQSAGGASPDGSAGVSSRVAVTSSRGEAQGDGDVQSADDMFDGPPGRDSSGDTTETFLPGRGSPDSSLASAVEYSSPCSDERFRRRAHGTGASSARTQRGTIGGGELLPAASRAVGKGQERVSGSGVGFVGVGHVSRDDRGSEGDGVPRVRGRQHEKAHEHGLSREPRLPRDREQSREREWSREDERSRARDPSHDGEHSRERGRSRDGGRAREREISRESSRACSSRERSETAGSRPNDGNASRSSIPVTLFRGQSRESVESTTSSGRRSRYPEYAFAHRAPTPPRTGSLAVGLSPTGFTPTPQGSGSLQPTSKGSENRSEESLSGSSFSRDARGAADGATSGHRAGHSAAFGDMLSRSRRERSSESQEGTAAAATIAAMAVADSTSSQGGRNEQETGSRSRPSVAALEVASGSLAEKRGRSSPDDDITDTRRTKERKPTDISVAPNESTRGRMGSRAQSAQAAARGARGNDPQYCESRHVTAIKNSRCGAEHEGSRIGTSGMEAGSLPTVNIGAVAAAGGRPNSGALADLPSRDDSKTSSPDAGAGPRATLATIATIAASATPTASSLRSTARPVSASLAMRSLPGSAEHKARRPAIVHAGSPSAEHTSQASSRAAGVDDVKSRYRGEVVNGGSHQSLSATHRCSSSRERTPPPRALPTSSTPWATSRRSAREESLDPSSNSRPSRRSQRRQADEQSRQRQAEEQDAQEAEDSKLAAAAAAVVKNAVATGRAARVTDTEGAPMNVDVPDDRSDATDEAPKRDRSAAAPGAERDGAPPVTLQPPHVRNSRRKRSHGALEMTAAQEVTSVTLLLSGDSLPRSKAPTDMVGRSRRTGPSTSSRPGVACTSTIVRDGSLYADLYGDGDGDGRRDRVCSAPIRGDVSARSTDVIPWDEAGRRRTQAGREGDTTVARSGDGGHACEEMPPKESSRERGNGRPSSKMSGGASMGAGIASGKDEQLKSVVQGTGAAAAAAVGDGGYGRGWDKLEVRLDC